MSDSEVMKELLTEAEALLQRQFTGSGTKRKLPSSAQEPVVDERMEQLMLPAAERPPMPYTKDKYLVKENPHLVQWEREVRNFLRNLTLDHSHRVSAVMIYEWATGISVAELVEAGGSANSDLRKINKILKFYFGKSYMTHIMGRKVPNCYRRPPQWKIVRHRPMTLTLYAEYAEGTLYP